MLGLEMLDVAIGMTFIFLMLSLICTALSELFEAWLKRRAVDLEHGIRELLHDEEGTGLASALYEHPLVFGLFRGKYEPEKNIKKEEVKQGDKLSIPEKIKARFSKQEIKTVESKETENQLNQEIKIVEPKETENQSNQEIKIVEPKETENQSKKIIYKNYKRNSDLPSYIPSRNFALSLMDIAWSKIDQPRSLKSLRSGIEEMGNKSVQKALLVLISNADDDLDKARENIEAWYDSSMDRVAGWYKRRAQIVVFILGAIVAVGMNADTIAIYKSLTNDEPLRNSLVVAAQEYAKHQENDSDTTAQQRIKENMDALAALGLPIGWNWKSCATPDSPRNFRAVPPWGWDWLFKIFGWLLTAVAISLGAPFWFDVLNKFMVIRSTVKPHEKSPEESSEDRQNSRKKGSNQAEAVLSGMEGMLKGFNAAITTPKQDKFGDLSEEKQHKIMVEAIEQNEEKWKTIYSNVAYLATGNKYIADKNTGVKCIVFKVKEKITDKVQLEQADTIPDYVEYQGFQIPTDIQQQGDMPTTNNFTPPPLSSDQLKIKKPGSGISRRDSREFGSLGMIVYRGSQAENRKFYLLSCYHVLCNLELKNNQEEVTKANNFKRSPDVVCPCLIDDEAGVNSN